jgi:hypothetical protein
VTVRLVAVFAVIVPAKPPNVTELVLLRFVPVIVTDVPPKAVPLVVPSDVIVGGCT